MLVCVLCASVCVQAYNHQCGHADALSGILDDITGLLDSVRSRQATALGGLLGPLGRQEKRSVFEQGLSRASKGGGETHFEVCGAGWQSTSDVR